MTTTIDPRIGSSRRLAELGLVVMAGGITAGAYVLASLGKNASIPARIGTFLGVVLTLIILSHIAVRKLARGADPLFLPVVALLHGIGLRDDRPIERASGRLAGDLEPRCSWRVPGNTYSRRSDW